MADEDPEWVEIENDAQALRDENVPASDNRWREIQERIEAYKRNLREGS